MEPFVAKTVRICKSFSFVSNLFAIALVDTCALSLNSQWLVNPGILLIQTFINLTIWLHEDRINSITIRCWGIAIHVIDRPLLHVSKQVEHADKENETAYKCVKFFAKCLPIGHMTIVPKNFTRLRCSFYNDFMAQKWFINFGNKGLSPLKISFVISYILISFFFFLQPLLLTNEILYGSVFAFLSFKSDESSDGSDQLVALLLN